MQSTYVYDLKHAYMLISHIQGNAQVPNVKKRSNPIKVPFLALPRFVAHFKVSKPNEQLLFFSPSKCRMYINQLNTITKFNACSMFVIIKILSVFLWNNRCEKKIPFEKVKSTIWALVELSWYCFFCDANLACNVHVHQWIEFHLLYTWTHRY